MLSVVAGLFFAVQYMTFRALVLHAQDKTVERVMKWLIILYESHAKRHRRDTEIMTRHVRCVVDDQC